MRPFISIIIPAYNEAKRIANTLLEIDHYLTSKKFTGFMKKLDVGDDAKGYEILVVDDGSKDNTLEIVKNLQSMVKNLRIIKNTENHGKGFVVRQGMLRAKGKFRIFTDADNATSIDHIEKMMPYFYETANDKPKYYVVIGSRAARGAKIKVHQPFYKEILGKMGNKFIQVMAVWGISDTQCGFKGFEEKAAKLIFGKATINRWGFDVEVLAIAKLLGYEIKEMPVTWVNDSDSHVSLKAYLQVLWETTKVRINIWRGKYK